jgi:Ni,Fe-hydrogenase III large subunit/Ni,Fe-hydrogenase III component G
MSDPIPAGATRTLVDIDAASLRERFTALTSAGYRLALVAAHHERSDDDTLRVVYLLVAGPPDSRVELHVRVPAASPSIPSLAAFSFPASRFEREMRDLYGIEPTDHPMPARLVLHQHWPDGWYPMRNDAGDPPPFGDESRPYPFLTVEGRGVYEIPVGPVHAGLIEPGHFRFSVVGETILNMRARLWFVHKGIERLFQGRAPADAIELSVRISGDTAVGHSLAYCMAVEDACGCPVPAHARALRAALLELERLYNHVTDIGALCNDVGFGVAFAHALRIRERLLRLNAEVTGHRLLRGGVALGGARVHRLPSPAELDAIAADIDELVAIALANGTVVDRFTGTAVLTADQAAEIGTLGYVARASGLAIDARHAHPFVDHYQRLGIPTHHSGDVLARFSIRVEEVAASLSALHQIVDQVQAGDSLTALRTPDKAPGNGVGIVEGWRGTIVHRIELGVDGTLRRVKIVDPSFFNWPALPVALADTIVPDFPLANKSFNLSYAGNDL